MEQEHVFNKIGAWRKNVLRVNMVKVRLQLKVGLLCDQQKFLFSQAHFHPELFLLPAFN